MSRKSVSLFEVLPPSSDGNAAVATPEKKPVASTPKPSSSPKASAPQPGSHYRNEVAGVSVREKNDHFAFIVTGMLCFSLMVGLLGYKLGRDQGIVLGKEFAVARHSRSILGVPEHVMSPKRAEPLAVKVPPQSSVSPAALTLPSKMKTMSAVQEKAVAPLDKRRFTLQIQTFGRNQNAEVGELVTALKSKGYDAFADYKRGVVYTGRFVSVQSSDAKRTKRELSSFGWKKRDFSSSFFNRIPTNLK